MIQILILTTDLVNFVCRNIYQPKSDVYLILTIIVVLCYFLIVAFCHFSNIYCLIGFEFIKRDVNKIQHKIEYLQEKEEEFEDVLRKATKYVDEKSEQGGFIKGTVIVKYTFVYLPRW